ncbi:MAG: molybdopterin biosynthesis protein [Pirellulales bacterium]|nr:molybdopterin biosynthesis protein [Pirellulales bacterium]
MAKQYQFLDVIDRDRAESLFHAAIDLTPTGIELVPLDESLSRIISEDIISPVNVPSFDRSNYDGFAVVARDTIGADEEHPVRINLLSQEIPAGCVPEAEISSLSAASIATGGMLPRGADAIVMIEHTEVEESDDGSRNLLVRRPSATGFGITYAGTDISENEVLLRRGDRLTSRDTGVLAAVGISRVPVWKKPRVAIISTGDEVISPMDTMKPALVYDSNARILADAVRELGGEPVELGIVKDDIQQLRDYLKRGIADCDVVLLSGGTSKGAGDLSYQVVQELNDPGIVAHGVALKPGKPICLAATDRKPVVILPGFPTSAIFTFHEFLAPVIQALAGGTRESQQSQTAKLAVRVNSEVGRTEYLLVGLGPDNSQSDGLAAYPMGKGSGSVTTFSRADGFITINRHQELLEADQTVDVTLLGKQLKIADLIVIGSHCVGLDFLIGELQARHGYRCKLINVGSTGGLEAARRGECDIAGIHLLDEKTGEYNTPFLDESLTLAKVYRRGQGIVFRKEDSRFAGLSVESFPSFLREHPDCLMVNRNPGSGTRILIDQLLQDLLPDQKPAGYAVQSKNHHAVRAAIEQGRADWGVAIESVITDNLGFLPITDEEYDFVIPKNRIERPAVSALLELLKDKAVREQLAALGFEVS